MADVDVARGDAFAESHEKNCKIKETVTERYKKCCLLNLIQHIDIHGKFCSSYHENRRRLADAGSLAVTSITSNSSKFLNNQRNGEVACKMDKFTVATRVASLYPGHDILSKKALKKKSSARNEFIKK